MATCQENTLINHDEVIIKFCCSCMVLVEYCIIREK